MVLLCWGAVVLGCCDVYVAMLWCFGVVLLCVLWCCVIVCVVCTVCVVGCGLGVVVLRCCVVVL